MRVTISDLGPFDATAGPDGHLVSDAPIALDGFEPGLVSATVGGGDVGVYFARRDPAGIVTLVPFTALDGQDLVTAVVVLGERRGFTTAEAVASFVERPEDEVSAELKHLTDVGYLEANEVEGAVHYLIAEKHRS